MKKIFCLLIFCFLIVALSPVKIYSADKTADEHYSDLISNYRLYQQAIGPFNTAKNQHQAYQTLDTEVALLDKSKKLLTAETVAMESYARFVRTRLTEATQILSYQENYLYIKLDDEISYFTAVRGKINNISLLSEVKATAVDMEKHYRQTQDYGYQVKSLIEILSAKKVWENIRVEKDKINNYLVSSPDDFRLKAAIEKVDLTKPDFEEIDGLLARADSSQKTYSQGNGQGVSTEIHKLLTQSIAGFSKIVSVFTNITNGF